MLPQKPSFLFPFAITMKSVAHILRSLEFQTIKAHLKVETKTLSFAVSKPMDSLVETLSSGQLDISSYLKLNTSVLRL